MAEKLFVLSQRHRLLLGERWMMDGWMENDKIFWRTMLLWLYVDIKIVAKVLTSLPIVSVAIDGDDQ